MQPYNEAWGWPEARPRRGQSPLLWAFATFAEPQECTQCAYPERQTKPLFYKVTVHAREPAPVPGPLQCGSLSFSIRKNVLERIGGNNLGNSTF